MESDPDAPGRLKLHKERTHSDGSPLISATGCIDIAALKAGDLSKLGLRIQLFDDFAHHGSAEWKKTWREFLRIGNLLQFLEGFEFVSSLGLADDAYRWISEPAAIVGEHSMSESAELIDVVALEVRDLCRKLLEAGKILPEAGYELATAEGEIIATAELAWSSCHAALLLEEEAGGAALFEAAGWRVFLASETLDAPETLLNLLPDEATR
jgi:hypothetical protein